MGYIAHDMAIATCSDYALGSQRPSEIPDIEARIEAFRASLPDNWKRLLVGPVRSITNGYATYLFCPDGSKSGWGTDKQGDDYRDEFVAIFNWTYDDGSSPFEVVQVTYGEDYGYEHGATVMVVHGTRP